MEKIMPQYSSLSPLGNFEFATLRLQGEDSARMMKIRILSGDEVSMTAPGHRGDIVRLHGEVVYDYGVRPSECVTDEPIGAAVRVIYNPPATIAIWADGSKTVVKCDEDDVYDPKYGLALCYMKKALGSSRAFNDALRAGREEEVRKFLKEHRYIECLLDDNYKKVCPIVDAPCSACPYRTLRGYKCCELMHEAIKKMREGEKHD